MKERGELRLGSSDHVAKGGFLLALTDKELGKGETIKNEDLSIIYVSVDASLADRLISLGIARKQNIEGWDVLLIVNTDQDIQF